MDERAAQASVADWLRANGHDVYWSEDPPEQDGRFALTGTKDRPDMLADGDLTVVLEMKDGTDSAGVYDAMRDIHEYWRLHEFKGIGIRAGGTDIDVDAFGVATQFSVDGHLFKRDAENEEPSGDDREKGFRRTYADHEVAWNSEMRPQYEYARTEAIPRIMWRYVWQEAEERQGIERSEITTGIGVLLSDALDTNPRQSGFDEFVDGPDLDNRPKMLFYDGEGGAQWTDC